MASSLLGDLHEEFHPKLELTETPEAHILQIHLPGFTSDQVKIMYVSSNKTLSIYGEKPEGGNRWSRFSEAVPVPANSEVNRLGAKFDKGILSITMPKKFITRVVPKEELTSSEEEISQDPSFGFAYEEFEPKVEKTENLDTYLLKVYLPGFSKDQVKIKYIGSSRVISISGERPIEGGRKWSRFDQAFPVPEHFNEARLRAKFELGVLTITVPKKFSSVLSPREEFKTSYDTGPIPQKDTMAEPKPHRSIEEVIPPKPMEGLKRISSLLRLEEIDQKPSFGAVYEEYQPKSEITENLEAYHLQIHLPGFTRDQVKIKYISSSKVMSVSGERPIERGNKWIRVDQAYPVPENSDPERVRGKFDQGILTLTMPKKFIPQVGKEGLVPKPTRFTLIQEQAAPRTASAEAKLIEETVDTIGKGIQEVSASASHAVTNIGDGTLTNEEKRLLGVLIAAIGAYVSYRLTNSGKPYNY